MIDIRTRSGNRGICRIMKERPCCLYEARRAFDLSENRSRFRDGDSIMRSGESNGSVHKIH